MRLFYFQDGVIHSRLGEFELTLLRMVPRLVASVGDAAVDPAASRLRPEVYRDDAERSAEFRRLAGELIDTGRADDVAAIAELVDGLEEGGTLSEAQAGSWMRAINQARLVLGARLGIEDDGWEESAGISRDDPMVILLHLLGRIQGDLIAALAKAL